MLSPRDDGYAATLTVEKVSVSAGSSVDEGVAGRTFKFACGAFSLLRGGSLDSRGGVLRNGRPSYKPACCCLKGGLIH